MPELPEVQTIVNQLKDKLVGRKIESVEVLLPKMFEGSRDEVIGARIIDVQRRAKIIILKLDNGKNIVVHLKMTGQLVYGEVHGKKPFTVHGKAETTANREPGATRSYVAETISFSQGIPFAGFELPGKTTHVIIKLADSGCGQNDGGTLFFNDMRQFGWMRIVADEQLQEIDQKHGPEPFSAGFTPDYLQKICSNWGRPVKLLLMEQSKIAGIGNIYANEALWYAGISPMKRGREIESLKVRELYEAIRKVLEMGIKYQGSSAADEAFVSALGEKGQMQDHFMVYQKNGQPCPRCGKTVTRGTLGGRGTFFCPKCQR